MQPIRLWLYQVLENNRQGFIPGLINIVLILLILANVVVIVISSEKTIQLGYQGFFNIFEMVSLVIFTIEYFIRVWVSIERSRKAKSQPVMGRVRHMFTPMALVDLLAILPSYLAFFGTDLLVLRALRLIRVFKLTRYSPSMELLVAVIKQEAETILSAIFVLLILIVISATGIYLVEGDVQPKHFGSIPRALWWSTVTLTTVGYGDAVPITILGKTLGMIIVITGIGMAALPAGIIASGFTAEVGRRRERFKMSIMLWLDGGSFDKHEKKDFEILRKELAISRSDAALMIREARREIKYSKKGSCPKCGYDLSDY